jgi:hypothetical protein
MNDIQKELQEIFESLNEELFCEKCQEYTRFGKEICSVVHIWHS